MHLRKARHYANRSILIFVIFVSLMTTMHILMPEFNPLVRTMSEYVVGKHGWMMVVAFMVLGIGVGTISLTLYHALDSSLRSRLIFFILIQAALGFFLAGVFPTDLIDEAPTFIGNIHVLTSFMGILGLPLALILLLRKLEHVEMWQGYYQTASKISFAALLWFFFWNPFLAAANFEGLGQRVFACFLLGWLLYTCFYVRKMVER